MNEQIKELALNSGAVPLVGHSGLIISNLNVEKFAELIVKECAKVAHRYTPDYEELEYSHLIKNKILDHFGVE